MTKTSNNPKRCYDETMVDINKLKHRRKEFDADLKDMIDEYLEKPLGYGYKNYLMHEMADRLLMIQGESGVSQAIKYFKWRIDGTISREEYYSAADVQQKEDRYQRLMDRFDQIEDQLKQMQILMLNIAGGMNDELLERRKKVV